MKWISVKDRLPDSRGRYIIYVDIPEEDYKKVWTIDIVDPRKGFEMPKEYGRETITHWMPLPEAPEKNIHFSRCQVIARIRNNCWNCKGMFNMGICDRGDDCDRKVNLKPKYRCVEGCEYRDELD